MKKIVFIYLAFLLAACTTQKNQNVGQNLAGLQSVTWSQLSSEAEALYLQGYNIATDALYTYLSINRERQPAVILDIDETVLDNSPFQAESVLKGVGYSEERWNEWCKLEEAVPLPGALRFTNLADSLGVEVFYISNRSISLTHATIENLRKYGFPDADSTHLLLKKDTSSKDKRRARVTSRWDVIMLLGDNLGDFDGVFDNREEAFGKPAVKKHSGDFGRKFIVFPNPMYGSWMRPAFPGGINVDCIPDTLLERRMNSVLKGIN